MSMKYFQGAQAQGIPSMNLDSINAFLSEVQASDSDTAPMTCGFFKMEAGNALEYTYNYDEFKILLEGELTISEKDGETATMNCGDVIFFEKGTTVTFSSNSSGTAFYVGQRRRDEL